MLFAAEVLPATVVCGAAVVLFAAEVLPAVVVFGAAVVAFVVQRPVASFINTSGGGSHDPLQHFTTQFVPFCMVHFTPSGMQRPGVSGTMHMPLTHWVGEQQPTGSSCMHFLPCGVHTLQGYWHVFFVGPRCCWF